MTYKNIEVIRSTFFFVQTDLGDIKMYCKKEYVYIKS